MTRRKSVSIAVATGGGGQGWMVTTYKGCGNPFTDMLRVRVRGRFPFLESGFRLVLGLGIRPVRLRSAFGLGSVIGLG